MFCVELTCATDTANFYIILFTHCLHVANDSDSQRREQRSQARRKQQSHSISIRQLLASRLNLIVTSRGPSGIIRNAHSLHARILNKTLSN